MRRDVGFYVEAPVDQVYTAYLNAATHKPFERDCGQEPYHTISFGVNFSFKYNMNGGSCHIHFMPYGTGTAVNFRFSIAQAAGARYGRYAEDLNTAMQRFLPVIPQPANFHVEDFLLPQNQVTPDTLATSAPATAPVVSSAPTPPAVATPAPATSAPASGIPAQTMPAGVRFCVNCGGQLLPTTRFCPQCGMAVASTPAKVCPNCHAQAQPNASFCGVCGTRL
ncbi:MAG: zinc ribbon domain-containing protein [Clostridia bacterium]|nr:zinc ribbon domain-containing protein [Clostridia bacterium]